SAGPTSRRRPPVSTDLRPSTRDEFVAMADALRARDGYVEPAAFGIGVATFAEADGSVLDTWYGAVNLDENHGAAAIVADVVGHHGGAATYELSPAHLEEVLARCAPVLDDGGDHRSEERRVGKSCFTLPERSNDIKYARYASI